MQDNSFTLIRDIKEINLKRGCVAAIGNFDGLHQGHQDIISSVTALAALHKLIPTIITFEPMPISYLKPSTPVCRLMSLSEKLFWLRKWGIEQVICLRFNQALSQLSPQAFVETILIKKLNMKHLIVGENFRFGYQQSGDILQLEALAKKYPFTLHSKPLLNVKNERLSSTALREALLAGNCEKARLILGRPYCISSAVKLKMGANHRVMA